MRQPCCFSLVASPTAYDPRPPERLTYSRIAITRHLVSPPARLPAQVANFKGRLKPAASSSEILITTDLQRTERTHVQPSLQTHSMQSESTVTGRRLRNLGLSVFNPDNSSDDDAVPVQRSTPQTTAQLLPKPLPVPGVSQNSYFPQPSPLQQQLQSPYTARAVGRQPSHPIHSASSSTSSISISTSLSSQPGFQFPNGARQIGAQSSPTSRYANASPLNYVGSSSSSRSSPAMDTTPPPATPSNNLPPVNFVGGITDDRNLDGLGLDVASETYYPPASSSNQSRHDVRNGLVSCWQSQRHVLPTRKLMLNLFYLVS